MKFYATERIGSKQTGWPPELFLDLKDEQLLFADVVGFAALSATMLSLELVTMLNELFVRFDRVVVCHGRCQKYPSRAKCVSTRQGMGRAVRQR